jgi:YD repeat-containing protein
MANETPPRRIPNVQPTLEAELTIAYDYDGSGNLIYIGKAVIGTTKAQAFWQIQQLTYNGSNQLTDTKWADGDAKYDNIWNNRAGGTYS